MKLSLCLRSVGAGAGMVEVSTALAGAGAAGQCQHVGVVGPGDEQV